MYMNRLREIRTLELTSQKDIASIIGLNQNTYSEYENEYKIMPIKHLNSLCNYFNVSLDYIFNFTDERQYENSNDDIDKKISGLRLKEFRKENKLTQVKLATLLNTAHPTITNYENGKNVINTAFLYTICKRYRISADYLLGKIDNSKHFK